MTIGPEKMEHAERLKIAEDIAARLKNRYRERVIAISIYGSLASGTDGPYSDIELDCVLDGLECDRRLEWCGGGWKAEVDIFSVSSILNKAAEVTPKWAVSHSIYLHYLPIYDPTNLYVHRRKTALSQPDYKFRQAIKTLITEEMFENQGKIYNAGFRKDFSPLPFYAVLQARWGALLLGLANHHMYSTSARIFSESLELGGRPEGYDELCQMVISGNLSEPEQVLAACDVFWAGVNRWAQENGFRLVDDLDDLLKRENI